VRENTYSGATTALLQAMASAKPVVVTRTAAIARGYHLQDGRNCRLVPPNDVTALERAVSELLEDGGAAGALAGRARETVERHLTWSHYTDRIRQLLVTACSPTTVPA
jgi:glycosyltransferase involved in cell wall biosynthesis